MAARRKKKNTSGKWLVLLLLFSTAAGLAYAYRNEIEQSAALNWIKARVGPLGTNRPSPVAKANATNDNNRSALPAPSAPPNSGSNGSASVPPQSTPTNASVRSSIPPAMELPPPEKRIRRPVRNALEAQIALARIGVSVGCLDGVSGENMRRALLAWQIHNDLPVSGELDIDSKKALLVEEPLFMYYQISAEDLGRLMAVPATWLEKSQKERLDYETILELVAEKGRSSQAFIRSLNPSINWTNITPGTLVKIPRVDPPVVREKAAFVRVHLYSKTLDVFGRATNLLAHFPCSIAARVEKRPLGTLTVSKVAANPNYLFDPQVFSESEEARKLGRKLLIPPGPNNPVGTAWIGLDKPGYGIHGTPRPELVGRTESHGCFRLANWNAEHLLQLSWIGMPVIVEP